MKAKGMKRAKARGLEVRAQERLISFQHQGIDALCAVDLFAPVLQTFRVLQFNKTNAPTLPPP